MDSRRADAPGFVPLAALRQGASDPRRALADIRHIYFKTTRQTIQHDLAHAVELLKSIPTEADREKARVYMDGLAQMRSEWNRTGRRKEEGTRKKRE
ncbi:MAG: hypothetical protein HY824_08500 [Acidobacteria bacterium]|nr:hypothetical protein [Acidobacteriota bacterium]